MTPRYFVIFGAMRTGSNLLERTLAALPGIHTMGEAYNPSFIGGPNKGGLPGWNLAGRNRDPLGFLEAMIASAPDHLIGFRHFDDHDPAVRAHALADPACARIVLRRDPLESYLSLKIAMETDQWLLADPRRRLVARVHFDPVAYEAHAARMQAYYAGLDRAMTAAETTALRLDYDDLLQPDIAARLAEHLGCDPGGHFVEAGITRQNPGPPESKVTNPDEMLAYVKRSERPSADTEADPRAVLLARQASIAFLPIEGTGLRAPLSMIHWFEKRDYGAVSLPVARLIGAAGEVFETGLDMAALRGRLHGRVRMTLVCPPAERLHRLFLEQAFTNGQQLPHVRRALDAAHGETGSLQDWMPALESEAGLTRHRARFAGFLELISDALAGRGRHPVHAGWRPQAEEVRAYERTFGLDVVLRSDRIADGMSALADCLSARPMPDAIRDRLAGLDRAAEPDLTRILTPDLNDQIRTLHEPDFDMFGFD
ncbi:MAG: hypothetical protein AAF415_01780 [Pseudomonadota bacterium]